MPQSPRYLLTFVVALAFSISACSAGPSASGPTPDVAASVSKLGAWVQAMTSLQVQYGTTAQEYKTAVEARDTGTASVEAAKLQEICASEAEIAPSGDSMLDDEWPQYASECAGGWADIARAFRSGDTSFIEKGHAKLDSASAHLLSANQRLSEMGQQLMAQLPSGLAPQPSQSSG